MDVAPKIGQRGLSQPACFVDPGIQPSLDTRKFGKGKDCADWNGGPVGGLT